MSLAYYSSYASGAASQHWPSANCHWSICRRGRRRHWRMKTCLTDLIPVTADHICTHRLSDDAWHVKLTTQFSRAMMLKYISARLGYRLHSTVVNHLPCWHHVTVNSQAEPIIPLKKKWPPSGRGAHQRPTSSQWGWWGQYNNYGNPYRPHNT